MSATGVGVYAIPETKVGTFVFCQDGFAGDRQIGSLYPVPDVLKNSVIVFRLNMQPFKPVSRVMICAPRATVRMASHLVSNVQDHRTFVLLWGKN